MRRWLGSMVGLLLLAGCSDEEITCICTPVGQIETTEEVKTKQSCEAYATDHEEEYSSCIQSSASRGLIGPTIALNLEATEVWTRPWPHRSGSLPALEPVWLTAR